MDHDKFTTHNCGEGRFIVKSLNVKMTVTSKKKS
jgi:hypothetical protein